MRLARLLKRIGRGSGGFTMIEILIVVTIIGILATVMVAGNFVTTVVRSRDTKRKSDVAEVAKALEAYVSDRGRYPDDAAGKIMGCGVGFTSLCNWGEVFGQSGGTVYMARLPEDARTPTRDYYYAADASGTAWQLFASLENENDPVLDSDGDGVADIEYTQYGQRCGTATCNYGISSTNVTAGERL